MHRPQSATLTYCFLLLSPLSSCLGSRIIFFCIAIYSLRPCCDALAMLCTRLTSHLCASCLDVNCDTQDMIILPELLGCLVQAYILLRNTDIVTSSLSQMFL
uniref:Putative secreted protein n=1 Tax=Amblyomma triste TaxID=251400 RepID=A0A023G1S4_AMBTT